MSLVAVRCHHLALWTEDTHSLACQSLPFAGLVKGRNFRSGGLNTHLQLQATTSKK